MWKDDFSSLYESAPNFDLNGKINNKSTRSDIVSAFGEPNQSNKLTRIDGEELVYKDTDGCSLTFVVSTDGSKLGTVRLDLGT